MNLRRRTATQVYIARPAPSFDLIGGAGEGFSAAHEVVWGHLLPVSGSLKAHAAGAHMQQTLSLLLPRGVDIRPGDGVGLTADDFSYRVLRCDRYPLHVSALLERRNG